MLFNTEGILDMSTLEDALDSYFYSTGISIQAIDETGTTILHKSNTEHFCAKLSKLTGTSYSNCEQTHLYSSKQSVILGEPYIFFCPSGFVHISAPLTYTGIFKGALIAGPIVLESVDDEFMKKMTTPNLLSREEKEDLLYEFSHIPVIHASKLRYYANLLFHVSSSLINEHSYILYENRKKLSQQSRINETIQYQKDIGEIEVYYPYEKEKELFTKVKTGDITGARAILNELLGYMFFSNGGNIQIVKARALEICSLLSRSAVEGGGEIEEILGLNYTFIQQLSGLHQMDEISFWILKVLDQFTQNVLTLYDSKNQSIIKKSISFINKNYTEALTLEAVANFVHLNASYFSTLFKKETGQSFSNYLNKVRIEQSKLLLTETNQSILDIAIGVGFENQSYFSKVFKSLVGVTPKQYKSNTL